MLNVVTGATGHIGNNLVRALLARGERVRAVIYPADDVRSLAGLDEVERVAGDVRDLDSLRAAFQGADRVYHLAGIIAIMPGQGQLLEKVNVGGTRNVAQACLECGVPRLVHTASIHALVEPPHGTVIDERMPFDAAHIPTEYGRSKARAARAVLEATGRGLNAVIVCPTGVIGPHDYQPSEMGRLFISAVRRRLPAYIHGAYDFVDVRDVAQGMIAAGNRGRCGESYLLAGEKITVSQLMAVLERITGERMPRMILPKALAHWLARFAPLYSRLTHSRPLFTEESISILDSNCCVSHDKASRELGYAPRPVEESVADTIHWFREVGMLPAPGQAALRRLESWRRTS